MSYHLFPAEPMNPDASIEARRTTAAPTLALTISAPARTGILRHSPWDALLVGLALLHGALLVLVPSVPLIALGLWWNANTISHNFIHLPFFRSRSTNVLFSALLSLLIGFPQSLWAARHLAHHRDEPFRGTPVRRAWLAQGALVLGLWTMLLALAPKFFLTVYLPGWLLGLGLCHLQGRFEHPSSVAEEMGRPVLRSRGNDAAGQCGGTAEGGRASAGGLRRVDARGTVSHYGWLYNWLFFNDGFHVEHHARPARHWTALPYSREARDANASPWPAVLRWLEHPSSVAEEMVRRARAGGLRRVDAGLDGLEELVCRSVRLRRFVLRVHERALARALAQMPRPRRVVIVGGGLFPRTALVLRRLLPEAKLTIVDMREDRITNARSWLDEGIEFVRGVCTAQNLPTLAGETDLVVVPLALRGRKAEFYRTPPAPHVLIHDWLWRRRGGSMVVSWLLLKRLNLVSCAPNKGVLECGSGGVLKPKYSSTPTLGFPDS